MKIIGFAALWLASASSMASAAPLTFDCPKSLNITQQQGTLADQSWEQVMDQGLGAASLLTIAVYSDHPSKLGSLVPDQTRRAVKTEITTWRLAPDPAPYWMACVYANSRILLAKPIPKEAKQCRLTQALLKQQVNGVVSFVCD